MLILMVTASKAVMSEVRVKKRMLWKKTVVAIVSREFISPAGAGESLYTSNRPQ